MVQKTFLKTEINERRKKRIKASIQPYLSSKRRKKSKTHKRAHYIKRRTHVLFSVHDVMTSFSFDLVSAKSLHSIIILI